MTSLGNGELVSILRATLSEQTETRRQAENIFLTQWVPRPRELFPQLATIMLSGAGEGVSGEEQAMAAVFFRRWISRESSVGGKGAEGGATVEQSQHPALTAWNELDEPRQRGCQRMLLEAFCRTDSRTVRNRIADAIGEVAVLVSPYEEWRELLELLVEMLSRPPTDLAVTGALLRIVAASPDLFANQDGASLVRLVQLLSSLAMTLIDAADAPVGDAVQALVSLAICFYEDEGRRGAFQPLVEETLPALIERLAQQGERHEETLALVLACAGDIVFECPRLFSSRRGGSCLARYVAQCGALVRRIPADSYGEEDAVGAAALEFVCAAVEGSPKTFRRDRALLEASAALLLDATAMEDDDDATWNATNPADEDDGGSMSVLGQQALDRFAIALGGAAAGPALFSRIGQLLAAGGTSVAWRPRFAALMAIAATGEGCAAGFLEDHLEGLLDILWPCFSDPHPRVQYAACHALGQLCTDFPRRIQADWAAAALSALVSLLQRPTTARVQCHAAAALVNFADGCESALIAPFLEGILGTLAGLLAAPGPAYVREQLLATIGAYSDVAQTAFIRHYEQVMPHLLAALAATETRKVQCRAVEAVSLVLYTVTAETEERKRAPVSLPADVTTTMSAFLQHLALLEDGLATAPADDPLRDFLPSAWIRMAQAMGPAFAPWLRIVLPGLLAPAEAPLNITEMGEAEAEAADADNNGHWEIARIAGRSVGINTAALADKALAFENLATLLTAVGATGFPDPGAIFRVALAHVNFEWSGDVRAAAVDCALAALECRLKQTGPSDGGDEGRGLAAALAAVLQQGLCEFYDAGFAAAALDALSSLLLLPKRHGVSFATLLPDGLLEQLYEMLPGLLSTVLANIRHIQMLERPEAEGDEEDDDEDGFTNTCDEEEVLYAWGRLQASIFEVSAGQAAPQIHAWALSFVATQITALTGKSKGPKGGKGHKGTTAANGDLAPLDNEAVQHVCLGVACDWVEWSRGEAAHYGQVLVDVCVAALSSPRAAPLVRQVGAHLAGQIARFGGAAFRDFCVQAAGPQLAKLVSRAEARAPSQLAITDNAVSALIRIHCAYPGGLAADTDTFISHFIVSGLPVLTDDAEIAPVAEFLLDAYRNGTVWAPAVLSALVAVKTSPVAASHLPAPLNERLGGFIREQLPLSSAKDRILAGLMPEQLSRL